MGARERVLPWAVVPPFWQVRPPIASGLLGAYGPTNVPAAVAVIPLVAVAGAEWKTDPGYEGVLDSLVCFVQSPTTLMDLTFQVTSSNAAITGLQRIRAFPFGSVAQTREFRVGQTFGQGVQLGAQVIVGNALWAGVVAVELRGWQWPITEREQAFPKGFGLGS